MMMFTFLTMSISAEFLPLQLRLLTFFYNTEGDIVGAIQAKRRVFLGGDTIRVLNNTNDPLAIKNDNMMPILHNHPNDDYSSCDDPSMHYDDHDEQLFPSIPIPDDQAIILNLDALTSLDNDLDGNIDPF